ncbi:MAG: anthranilate phosphoribosyltransferase [Gemmatimonadetes bacterium]|nr:anthranilate phosphoribosyltransferase [Gemmatimonadota bacterium]
MSVASLLDTLATRHLNDGESYQAFRSIAGGDWSEVEIAALLGALKTRGETADVIVGAARALRAAAVPFPKPPYPITDTCGTGGDGAGTVNLSTAVAFVAAAGGVRVVKHGNRAASSRCGSADVLEALGVNLTASAEVSRRCLDLLGICFLFAPHYHRGVHRAGAVRATLKTRTLFNLLGPLANPALPEYQVVGVYAPELCHPVATTLARLGCLSALVVHGGGLDELALHAPTVGYRLAEGRLSAVTIRAEDYDLTPADPTELRGADATANARWLQTVLAGGGSRADRDAVALNAGAAFWVTGIEPTLAAGVRLAHSILADGRAAGLPGRLAELSHA